MEEDLGHREFGGITKEEALPQKDLKKNESGKVKVLRENIVGHLSKFSGPFGEKPLIYADW